MDSDRVLAAFDAEVRRNVRPDGSGARIEADPQSCAGWAQMTRVGRESPGQDWVTPTPSSPGRLPTSPPGASSSNGSCTTPYVWDPGPVEELTAE